MQTVHYDSLLVYFALIYPLSEMPSKAQHYQFYVYSNEKSLAGQKQIKRNTHQVRLATCSKKKEAQKNK